MMQIIGHRGVPAIAPENTWASFDAALVQGVDAIETDVRATSDGRLVLIHDKNLERTTNGNGLVKDTPWSVIKDLDAGSWFHERHAMARVPTLQATLVRYAATVPLVLEIKKRGIELAAVETVQALGFIERITFTSFHFDVLQRIKRELPLARAGYLSVDTTEANVKRAAAAGLTQFCPPARDVTRERVRGWKRLGLEVRVWGVSNRDIARAAREAGVDGVTVDRPDWARG